MKKNFYSLLFSILLPIWTLWQVGWQLAFQYGINYQYSDVYLLISVKLGMESLYFLVSGLLLFRTAERLTIPKLMIVISILGLSIHALLTSFRII